MKKHLLIALAMICSLAGFAKKDGGKGFTAFAGKDITYSVENCSAQVVSSALNLFGGDLKDVLGSNLVCKKASKAQIRIKDKKEGPSQGFSLTVSNGRIDVVGNDSLGTAYGIMELSRLLGVSPWTWWADCTPAKKAEWTIDNGYKDEQSPAVLYRGIFINDEDNGLTPWSWKTYDPSDVKGRIGPKTHERIFQLLLRLRANVFWPAMHSRSTPFFTIAGNREMAVKYGIMIGTSHCEPMLRNTNGEWKKFGKGEYNYVTNREGVLNFWRERVSETRGTNGFYTLGMRGIHDTGMVGVNTMDEQKKFLQEVINDQRQMIKDSLNPDPTKIHQVFIPYKEVLPVYNAGLKVPDDVTLIWCDDNYGYIRHQPTDNEASRSGGNGLYYHFSYWGRPQPHVWIPSVAPALIREELARAYDNGNRTLWVFNVGDIKPNEYITELGLDLAWNGKLLHDTDINNYQKNWITREFGKEHADDINKIFNEYYRLSYKRRAEMLGHIRSEENDPAWRIVSDLPWTDGEVRTMLDDSRKLARFTENVENKLQKDLKTRWFELVGYQVYSYNAMANSMLTAQLARHGKEQWDSCAVGNKNIYALTDHYHHMLGGKWNEMMGLWSGRSTYRLPDSTLHCAPNDSLVTEIPVTAGKWDAAARIIPELGYLGNALSLPVGSEYSVEIPAGTDNVTVCLVPLHPGKEGKLQFEITLPDGTKKVVDFQTVGRSEEWKLNIENNQSRKLFNFAALKTKGTVSIKALTSGVILDELRIIKK